MSNVFVTPTAVAEDAAVALSNRLVVGNLISRSTEDVFADKVGDTVTVSIPPVFDDADEFTGTTETTAIVQGAVALPLEKHLYRSVKLTTKQRSLQLNDFSNTVTVPVMTGISASIDRYMLRKMSGGFRRNVAGTVANRPSTLAHVGAGQKALDDAWMPQLGRIGLTDSTVKQSLAQLAQFSSRDYVDNNALNAAMGMNGISPDNPMQHVWSVSNNATWVLDPHMGAFDRGDIAGSVTATKTAGQSTIALAAFTEATGVIREGTSFTAADDTTRYTVTEDATIAGNAATVKVYPAVTDTGSTKAVTFEGAGFQNMLYLPNTVAGAIVAPSVMGDGQAVATYNGVTVRVSMGFSTETLAHSIVFDVLVGCKVIQPNGGVIVAG